MIYGIQCQDDCDYYVVDVTEFTASGIHYERIQTYYNQSIESLISPILERPGFLKWDIIKLLEKTMFGIPGEINWEKLIAEENELL